MAFWNTDKDYYNKAQKLFEKKYDKECLSAALENIQKAVSKNPEEAKYYALQGAIHYEKKEYNESLQDIRQAIKLCDSKPKYWDLLGEIQTKLEKYSDAKNSYYMALSKFTDILTPDYRSIQNKFNNITNFINKKTEEYYTHGKNFYDNKIYPEAIEQFEQAILLNPDDANVYYFMADSEYRVTQYDKAIKYINIGITKKPNDLYHYYKLSGWIKEEKNDLENAKQDYIKALENNPDRDAKEELERDLKEIEYKINIEKAEEYYQKSKLEFKKKEYSKTIDLIQKAIIAKSDNPDYWYWLARAYYKLESWNNVIENLNAGIALKPMDIFHYYHLRAGAKVETEDIEGAVADYKEALKHNPDKITYNKINKSLILTEDKINTKKAEEYFDEGAGLYDNKNYGEAIKCLEKACELNNKNPDYFYWCGLAYYSNNDYGNAKEKFKKACVLDENDADNFYWLALAYFEIEDFSNAIKQLTKGIKLKPDDIYYYYDLRGEVKCALEDLEGAKKDYNNAIKNADNEDNIQNTKIKLEKLSCTSNANLKNDIKDNLENSYNENDSGTLDVDNQNIASKKNQQKKINAIIKTCLENIGTGKTRQAEGTLLRIKKELVANNSEYYYALAKATNKLNRNADAKQYIMEALQLSPNNNIYKQLRDEILVKLGEKGKYNKSEQKGIIEAPKDISFLVDAAPGTGKTYTIIQKAIYLVNEEKMNGQNIIILSHTNAVVNEIKSRFRKYIDENINVNRSLNNVNVRTICSFVKYCLYLLDKQRNDNDEQKKSTYYKYEASETGFKKANCELLNRLKSEKYDLKKLFECLNVKYFIVDEIQDAVNEIGQLILEFVKLCKNYDIPIALFGDKCQAIFDFEKEKIIYPINSRELYKKLETENYMPTDTKYVKIEGNKRQQEDMLKYSSDLDNYRKAILNEDLSECKKVLDKIKNDSPDTIVQDNNITEESTHCILTHSNNRTLYIASVLRKNKIPVYVKVKNSDITFEYSDWIAKIFFDNCTGSMTKDKFKQIVQERNIENSLPKNYEGYDKEDAVGSLYMYINKEIRGSNDGNYRIRKIEELLEEIYIEKNPNNIFKNTSKNKIEVSTIHKAKGREFDCVHIDSECYKNEKFDDDKYNCMYVALTRPKQILNFVKFNMNNFDYSQRMANKFGSELFYIINKKVIKQYKVLYDDIDIKKFNTQEHQEIIRTIKPNEEITLKNEGDCYWAIIYNNQTIGAMNKSFNNNSKKYLKELPTRITNLYVDGVWTVFDRDDDDKIQLWNAISFCGFGDVKYD